METRAGAGSKFKYMSRDTQRHDKLVGLLEAELSEEAGLSKAAQIALAKDFILRDVGLQDPDSLVRARRPSHDTRFFYEYPPRVWPTACPR